MCCFSQPVIAVNNTQIFARPSGKGTQFLAYQMNYESSVDNAMILPLPVRQPANDNSLKFIDLSHYDVFFDDLARGFPFQMPPSIGCSGPSETAAGNKLQVFEVGNYIASFVPTLADFDRLAPQFTLRKDVWAQIPQYIDFGFAVFQLASGAMKPHPMAFEFQTANDDLFFPTMHIHDGEIHASEEFDHILYLQHAGLDSKAYGYQNAHIEDKSTGFIRSKYPASQFCRVDQSAGLIAGDLLIHRKIVQGNIPNKDTVFTLTGDPLQPSFNYRPWLNAAPWFLALATVAWFFHRRSKLKKQS